MPKKQFNSITKANDEIKRLRSSKSRLSREVKTLPMGDALKNFASISAGAAALGVAKSTFGDELMDVPIEPMGGGAMALTGYFLEMPFLIYAAAGFLAPYIADLTEDMMEKQ